MGTIEGKKVGYIRVQLDWNDYLRLRRVATDQDRSVAAYVRRTILLGVDKDVRRAREKPRDH